MFVAKNLNLKAILIIVSVLTPVFSFANDMGFDGYHEMIKGDVNSEFTIVEYASFTCPHCASFHKEVVPHLEPYINEGKLKFIYREVYFDAPGLWAGLLARCADKQMYFGIVDLLYKKQERWASGTSEKEILTELFSIGRQVGLKEEKINLCLKNKEKSLKLIDAYLKNSKADNITTTPSVLFDGELITYSSFDDLKLKLDVLLN